jgi:hypothetical protein
MTKSTSRMLHSFARPNWEKDTEDGSSGPRRGKNSTLTQLCLQHHTIGKHLDYTFRPISRLLGADGCWAYLATVLECRLGSESHKASSLGNLVAVDKATSYGTKLLSSSSSSSRLSKFL